MDGRPETSGGVGRASPWPLLVALGLAVSELAIFVGYVPVAVAGLVLFGGAGAGLAHEAGFGSSPGGPMLLAGALFLVIGGVLWGIGAPTLSVEALLAAPGEDAFARRGLAVLVAGGLLVATGGLGPRLSTRWNP